MCGANDQVQLPANVLHDVNLAAIGPVRAVDTAPSIQNAASRPAPLGALSRASIRPYWKDWSPWVLNRAEV